MAVQYKSTTKMNDDYVNIEGYWICVNSNDWTDSVKVPEIKPIPIEIKHSIGGFFKYGNCALCAIGNCFDIDGHAIKAICLALNITSFEGDDESDEYGLTFNECSKLIKHLCKVYPYTWKYFKNKDKLSYETIIRLDNHKKLTVFDNHLSFSQDRTIFDSFYLDNYKALSYIPTGWWEIK